MEQATEIYNSTENGITKSEPNEVATDPVKRFDMQAQASINLDKNTRLITKRKDINYTTFTETKEGIKKFIDWGNRELKKYF